MNSPLILKSLNELARLVKRKEEVSETEIQSLSRLLRPQSSETGGHVAAIKHKLRGQILAQADRFVRLFAQPAVCILTIKFISRTRFHSILRSNANGPVNVAEFERLLDYLEHQSPSLVSPVLSVLEPLAFHKHVARSSANYFNISKEKNALRVRLTSFCFISFSFFFFFLSFMRPL